MSAPEDGRLLGLKAWLLQLIDAGVTHGYGLERRLEALGVAHDDSSIYRSLREMAAEGIVSSSWDDSHDRGPVRRSYRPTDTGRALLAAWRSEAAMFGSLGGLATVEPVPAGTAR